MQVNFELMIYICLYLLVKNYNVELEKIFPYNTGSEWMVRSKIIPTGSILGFLTHDLPFRPWTVFGPIFQSALRGGKTKFSIFFLLHRSIRNKNLEKVKNCQLQPPPPLQCIEGLIKVESSR